jgi:RHH-type proline utilization regulon transcriptional repressor/proline dehydrogenase/delta 1-pyrroline-5-carboxylate dehydrogenase
LPADVNAGEELPGPTGETNTLYLRPRGRVACIADTEGELAEQARVATATGNLALLAASASANRVRAMTGIRCELVPDPLAAEPDVVLFAGTAAAEAELRRTLAARPGPIVALVVAEAGGYDATRLLSERTVTINTTASGGNASLLSLAEAPG